MHQGEHSAVLLTCIKQKLVLKTNFRSFWEWPFYTGFNVFTFIQFCGFVLHFHIPNINQVFYIFCVSLEIPRILRTLTYFRTVHINIQKYDKIWHVVIKFPDFSLTFSKISIFPDSIQKPTDFSLTLFFSFSLTFSWLFEHWARRHSHLRGLKIIAQKVLVKCCGSITRLSLNSCHDNKWINRDTPKNKKHLVSITTLINSWTNRVIKLLDKSRSHKNIHLHTKCQSKLNSPAVVVCRNISEASWSNSVDPAQTAPLGTV